MEQEPQAEADDPRTNHDAESPADDRPRADDQVVKHHEGDQAGQHHDELEDRLDLLRGEEVQGDGDACQAAVERNDDGEDRHRRLVIVVELLGGVNELLHGRVPFLFAEDRQVFSQVANTKHDCALTT